MSLFHWKNEREIVNGAEQLLGSAERVLVYTLIYLDFIWPSRRN